MSREGGHLTNLTEEEDEQSSSKRRHFVNYAIVLQFVIYF